MGIMDKMKGMRGNVASVNSQVSFNKASRGLPQITKMNAILFAGAGGFIVALIALLIPVYILEMFTGASGLSEIIPAASAPLGFTARILFVAFLAILSSAILLIILMRFATDEQEEYMTSDEVNERARARNRMPVMDDDTEIAQKIYQQDSERYEEFEETQQEETSNYRDHSAGFKSISGVKALATKMRSSFRKLPFMGGDDSVRSFDDLPKLRNADSHPDAPPRRPLSANEDLGDKILDPENNDYDDVQDESDLDEILGSSSEEHLQDIEMSETLEASAKDITGPETTPYNAEAYVEEAVESEVTTTYMEEIPVEAADFEEEVADINHDVKTDHNIDDQAAEPEQDQPHLRKVSDDNDLPTLDDLMKRLDKVVMRRRELRENIDIVRSQGERVISDDKPASIDLDNDASKTESLETIVKTTASDTSENLEKKVVTQKIGLVAKKEYSDDTSNEHAKEASESQKQEMDSALQAALDTLHKMNERSA